MNKEKEFARYLNREGFQRFNQAWIEKYQKLGYLGGSICLNDLTNREKECLSGLLGLDLSAGYLNLTYTRLKKIIDQTCFEYVDFLKTLEYINGHEIKTNKELKVCYENKFQLFKESILNQYKHSPAFKWLDSYFQTDKMIKKYYNEDSKYYKDTLNNVCRALNQLPIYHNDYQLLAIFAQNITKDPHYFDDDFSRELLVKGIVEVLEISNTSYNEILYEAGILKDDLSNYCYICHIKPLTSSSYDYFYNHYEPINFSLYNLHSINELFLSSQVLVIENPSIFRELMFFIKERHLNIGLICSNGQINLCTYQLLDRLVKSECMLYYCGDFDPEGLLIADKLKSRYKNHLKLWQYTKNNFNKAKTGCVNISQRRRTLLQNIQNPILKEIASLIKNESSFAYQEGLVQIYKSEIEKLIKKDDECNE